MNTAITGHIIQRRDKETGETSHYNSATGIWESQTDLASLFDEETAKATIRCFETKARQNRDTTFTYDTLVM